MLKEENRIWWYLLGVVIMMVLLLIFGRDYFVPIITGQRSLVDRYTYFQPPSMQLNLDADYFAQFETSKGMITADLYENSTPRNVNNFVFLAEEDYYAGTSFHRIIPEFLVQGGDRNTLNDDPNDDGLGNTGYFIQDEINWESLNLVEQKQEELAAQGYSSTENLNSRPLERFSLVMANSGPNTNSSQFFFVIANPGDPRLEELNGYFTVIGRVVSGGDNLLDIGDTPVDDPQAQAPRPEQQIILEDVEIVTNR